MKTHILYIFLLLLLNQMASAQWLCPWENRLPMKIGETSGSNLSNHQVRIDLTYQAGMKADFSDIRFTQADGLSLLDYWIEYFDPSHTAIVWVKLPSLPANGSINAYLYYCNTNALNVSNASNTFAFFDDFTTWTGWNNYNSGIVTQDNTSFPGNSVLAKTTNCDPQGGYKLIGTTLSEFRLITREIRLTEGGTSCSWNRYGVENSSFNGYNIRRNADQTGTGRFGYERRNGGSATNTNDDNMINPRDNWYRTELKRCSSSSNNITASLYKDNRNEIGSVTGTNTIVNSFDRITIRGGYPYYVDFMAVAKYTCSDPIYVFGTLEQDLPTALCQNLVLDLDQSGNISTTATALDNGSLDECGIQNISINKTDFTCADIGANTVIFTATDLHNNTATCEAIVTIKDNLAPSINCPSDITITANASACSAIVIWTEPTISDNCGIDDSGSDYTSGSLFSIGTTLVTYFALDVNGNQETCSFSVTVNTPAMPLDISIIESSGLTNGDGTLCNGDVATLSATTGYSLYSWSTGENTPDINVSDTGIYMLTVQNSIGCKASTSTNITVVDRPEAGTCNLTHDYCEENLGSVTLEVIGGAAPYNFSWTPLVGSTTSTTINNSGEQADITNIPGGTIINISVSDANGCTAQ